MLKEMKDFNWLRVTILLKLNKILIKKISLNILLEVLSTIKIK